MKRIAIATWLALRFLARRLSTLLAALVRFIALRAIPAAWRWLRGTAFPALRRLYLWLPHRRAVVAVGALSVVAAAWIVLPFQSGSGTDAPDRGPSIKLPAREGKWVEDLLSGNWNKQKAATKTVLRHTGVTVLEDNQMPAAHDTLYVIPPELTLLTIDGAQKATTGRITLVELAQMMRDLDFPFAEGQAPGVLLRDGIRDWVRAALDDPKQAGAHAPLFLYAMAAQQRPALDLASDDWRAEEYQLTYLELHVFLMAFYQALPAEQIRQASRADTLLSLFIGDAHASKGACADLQNYITSRGEQIGEQDIATITNFVMQKLVGKLTGMGLEQMGKAGAFAKRVMIPLNTILKLQKLAMLYGSMDMSLTADQKLVHKPGRHEAGKELTFIATAGVDEDKYAEYLEQWNSSPAARTIKSCLSYLGLPMPTDTADIAGEIEHWRIKWELLGSHATYGTEKNEFESVNQRRMRLKPINSVKGKASFVVDLRHEEGDHEGDQVTGYISGKATLTTERPPLADKFIDAGKAGADGAKGDGSLLDMLNLGNIAIDLFAGFLQKLIDPVKYYEVAIVDHKHRFADYSYRGTAKGHNSRYKSAPNPGWISFKKLQGKSIRHESLSFDGEFETVRSSFTPDRRSAHWYLEGEARKAGMYDYFSHGSASGSCVGGGSVSHRVKVTHSGSRMYATPAKLSMNSTYIDGRHRIQVTLNHNPGVHVEYKSEAVREDAPSGCLHTKPARRTESRDGYTQLGMASLRVDFESDDPYPEVIAGSKEVKEPDGSITHWEWNFQRQEPSEHPTYVDAIGG